MKLEELLELSDLFGSMIRVSLEAIGKEGGAILGGGLRHGSPEWQVAYEHDGLKRAILFTFDRDALGDPILWMNVAVNDDAGGWAEASAGMHPFGRRSETVTVDFVIDLLNRARAIANELTVSDLRRSPKWEPSPTPESKAE